VTVIRVIDFETTGTEPPEAEVCEVGTCDLDLEARRVHIPRTWMCGVKAMPPEVRAVHHISLADCAGWDAFAADTMFDGGRNASPSVNAIAAHNSEFETKFFTSPVPVICTYKAALRVWPDAPSHSNGALRYWLEDQGKIAPDHSLTQPAHRAGPDAYVTAHILLALFDAGATGREMIAWTKEPRLLPTCPIGKFRGKPWSDVEAGFLGWMLRQETMEPDLKWNAEREIARRQQGIAR
jgi:exodeoxyribonuclease X